MIILKMSRSAFHDGIGKLFGDYRVVAPSRINGTLDYTDIVDPAQIDLSDVTLQITEGDTLPAC